MSLSVIPASPTIRLQTDDSSSGIYRIDGSTAIPLERSQLDTRSFCRKAIDRIKSVFREMAHAISMCYHRFFTSTLKNCETTTVEQQHWTPNSKGLIVFVHGLKSNPHVWYPAFNAIFNKQAEEGENHLCQQVDILVPRVPHQGDCSLEEAARNIATAVKNYVIEHPGVPVSLVGLSNGARIVMAIENELREEEFGTTPVKVSCISSPILGSSFMTFLDNIGFTRCLYKSRALVSALCFGSHETEQELRKTNQNLPSGLLANHEITFFGDLDDWKVPNVTSILPAVREQDRLSVSRYAVFGHGHSGILRKVFPGEINEIFNWMQREQPRSAAVSNLV